MATASPPTGKRNYVDFDEYIDFQISRTRANIRTTDILTALAGVATLVLAYILVFVIFDHWIVAGGFSTTARWLMLGGLLVGSMAWVVWRVVMPYRRRVSGLYAAKAIETSEPNLKYSLLNLVDLKQAGRPVPPEIERALQKRAAVTLHKGDPDAAVNRRPLMQLSYALLALVVIWCLYALLSPKQISASVWRALFPASQTAVDTAIKIDRVAVEHKGQTHEPNISVAARTRLKVIADLDFNGDPPEEVTLYFSTADRKFQDVAVPMKLDPEIPKRYFARLEGGFGRGIRQNTTYHIVAGDAKAGPFEVTIVSPPVATVRSVRYVYPQYMDREPRTQDGGHIEAWEGTDVTVNAVTDQTVTKAWLVFTKTRDVSNKPVHKVSMRVEDGTKLSVTLKNEITLCEGSHPHFYHIESVGQSGFKDPDPAIYGVTIRQDRRPRIQLLDPAKNEIELPANTPVLPVLYKAEDDFAVRFVTLKFQITRNGEKPGREFSEDVYDGREKSLQKSYDWRLAHHQFQPGDLVKFHLHVRDNMPQRTRKAPWCNSKPQSLNEAETRSVVVRFTEKQDQDAVNRQVQQRRQQQQQRQDEHEKNKDDGNPQPPQDDGMQKDAKKKDQGQKGKAQKKDAKKGNADAKKNGGGNTGEPQPGQKNRAKPDLDPNKGQKAAPRQSGNGDRPPMTDEERLEQLLKEKQERDRQKGKQETPDAKKQDGQKPKPDPDKNNQTEKKAPGKTEKKQPDMGDPMNGMDEDGMRDAGKKKESGTQKKPAGGMDKKKPNGGTSPDKKNPGNANKPMPDGMGGGNDVGMKSNGDKTNGSANQPGMKSESKKKQPDKGKRKSDSDPMGPEKTVKDNGSPAKKKKADGTETGPAQGNKDPNADPTKARDSSKLKKDPGDEGAKRKRTGMGEKTPKKENGSEKPGVAKPKPKTQKSPVDEKSKPNSDTVKKKSKTTNEQNPPAGNKPPEGMPKDQKSEKPDNGADGKGTPNKQGTKGSKQQGTGDDTKKQGSQTAGKNKTGKPGAKSGKGDPRKDTPGKKAGGKKNGSKPGPGNKSNSKTGQSGRAGKNPGTTGGVPGDNDTKGKTPNKLPGGQGERPGKGPYSPPPEQQREEADLEYGRKAANLVLDRLEGKVKRGEVTDEWLKKHNFKSKEEAIKFARQQRERFNNESLDSQTKEFLKSIRYRDFQKNLKKRTGENVRKQDVPGVGTEEQEDIPPHLRRYYKAFRRSLSK